MKPGPACGTLPCVRAVPVVAGVDGDDGSLGDVVDLLGDLLPVLLAAEQAVVDDERRLGQRLLPVPHLVRLVRKLHRHQLPSDLM